MTFVLKNRVKMATQLTGVNPTVTLTAAVSKFQTFAASGLVAGNTFPYLIESTALPEWEVGLGTVLSSTTFTRTSVYNSSNSGALVDFSQGTKYVTLTIDAATLQAAVTPSDPVSFADIIGTASVSQIPSLPSSKITSGVFDSARIPYRSYDFSEITGIVSTMQLPAVYMTASNVASIIAGSPIPAGNITGTLTHAQMASYAFSDITGTISVGQLPATYLTSSDVAAILAASPTINTFSNAQHNHQGTSGGGTLTTAAIASGTFTTSFIPTLGDAKISDLAVTKLTGTLTHAQMAPYAFSDITGTATLAQLPATIPLTQIGTISFTDVSGAAVAAQIPSLDAAKITSGIFSSARIPALPYVTSVGLALPSEFTVTNSPVTGSGSFTGAWANQTTGKFFAAPNGSTGVPTFRVIAKEDIAAAVVAGGIPFAGTTNTLSSHLILSTSSEVRWINAGTTHLQMYHDGSNFLFFNATGAMQFRNTSASGNVQIFTSSLERARFEGSTGNIFFGNPVVAAGAKFHVNGAASSITMIARQNSTPGTVSIQEWQNSSGVALALIDYLGVGRFTGLRVDIAPTASVQVQSHYINVNLNGTMYKLLLAA